MIIKGSKLSVCDNSGGLIGEVFCIYGGSRIKVAKIGSRVKIAIKKAVPNGNVKSGSIYNALIVRTKYMQKTFDGGIVRCGNNGCILLDNSLKPIANQGKGYISKDAFKSHLFKDAATKIQIEGID